MATEATPQPDAHEQRIAELRARRRARVRWLAVRGGIGLAVLLLGLLVLAYWLLQTVAGRDVLLSQVVARLPANASLTWKQVEGPLAGPLTLRGVDLHWDKIHFSAERIYLDPDIRPLLGKRLRLDAMEIEGAMLDMPSSDEPFELPRWPDVLPAIEMPLAIQADDLKIDGFVIRSDGQPTIDIRKVRGGIDIGNGYVHADKVAINTDRGDFQLHGGYLPGDDYKTQLKLSAQFPASGLGKRPARLGLVARGDIDRMVVAVAGYAPKEVRLTMTVQGRKQPTWHLDGRSDELDLAALGVVEESLPLSFALKADGADGSTHLRGRVQQGQWSAMIEPSTLSIKEQVLDVHPLVVRLLDGRVRLRGTADFSESGNPRFKFAVNARGVRWGEGEAAIAGDADLGIAGQLRDWASKGTARLQRDGEQAELALDIRGDDKQAQVHQLQARMPTGTLDAEGRVGWTPRLDWDASATLAGFDPGYFLSGWQGNVSGQIASQGQLRDDGGIDATADIPKLSGQLRGRALSGHGKFALQGEHGRGELALSLGSSRVQAEGSVGKTLDIDARLQPLLLSDLLPGSSGQLAGSIKLTGPRDAPTLDSDLTGNGLNWEGYSAETLSVRGKLPWRGGDGQLAVRGTSVNAGLLLQQLRLDLSGAVEDITIDADAQSELLDVAINGHARKQGPRWLGQLQQLTLVPAKGAQWRLQAPADFSQQGNAFSLSQSCLVANGGGNLCVVADWPKTGLSVQADALPLTLVNPWLPQPQGAPLNLRGEVSLDASLRPQGNAWAGEVHVASMEGALRVGKAVQGHSRRGEVIRYDHFSIDATFTPQRIEGRLGTGFQGDGYVDATFDTGWDPTSPLSGDLYFNNSRLVWMELFSPDLVQPTGVLAGHIGLAGSRGQPALSGEATLTGFNAELPSLGIALSEGNVDLTALADGSASIRGTVKTGEGLLNLDGSLGWNNTTTPLVFHISGDNLLVSDTPDLRAVASPDIVVSLVDNSIQVRGEVTVPSALIDVERLSQGVSASPDVVVLDPVDPEQAPDSPLDLQLAISLGDDVKLKGYGLEGALTGTLNVRSRQGQEMLAQGRLDVEGRYEAYGQKLDITRGALTWSNNPVSDPRIDIRAQREIVSADVTAGIDVTGRAQRPRATVWSDPATSESEALSYLVLGRSLSTASSDESQQINAASTALSAGAGLLASQLGARIGLDDAGVLESRTVGGSVFGVGKYLSPKLYVSYGVSTIGLGSVVTLKYLLRKGFDAEVETSTIETRGSINWRREK
ncbi:translocation/assembly module TamB domain-containing protein [Pseudoxanthomonas dokdonensis]|uniref:translocation/assembly module TamB domain-containing protein n=1 Tax=Pseudoxanthomonas dokdonensis TaxID=344882 RepID=UPI0009F990F3|nr:translocation/assembly module TamB domain-containing protein [Pseudoxanthomonas dokdonensis]